MGKHQVMETLDPAVRAAIDHVGAVAPQLHKAISDTLAKRAGATAAEVEGSIQKANEATDSGRSAMRAQSQAQGSIKQLLTGAIEKLEPPSSTPPRASNAPERRSVHPSPGRSRMPVASGQQISEAVAARHSERAAKQAPPKQAS